MTNKIFGTDGVRGRANQYPMTAEIALKIGMAASFYLGNFNHKSNRVVIGKDTRISGYMIETALTAGLVSTGKDVFLLGPMPTHGVSLLTRTIRADLGIMISASHNPYYDNGIKIFDCKGYKLSDKDEIEITNLITQDVSKMINHNKIGRVRRLEEARGRYLQYVKSVVPVEINFRGLHVVLDCANGAAYKIAPESFFELGAKVSAIGVSPDGYNINDRCGSTYPEALSAKVKETGADIGIAFDGDADRLIIVDEKGNIVDGDKILAVLAVNMKEEKILDHNKVVGTYMSNMALENYLASNGISLIRVNVGDKYVNEKLNKEGIVLGGEQSGHMIIRPMANTGDGLISALKIISYLVKSKKRASEFFNVYENAPQSLVNIKMESNLNPLNNPKVAASIQSIQKQFAGKARILVRKSGTEPLIRVMVESKEQSLVNNITDTLVNIIKS